MSKFAYSMSDGEAVLAFKKGFMGVGVGNIAILRDKGNAFVLGAPMMEVDVRFENGIVTTNGRGMGKTLVATVDTKIELIEGFRKVTDAEAKAIQSGASSQLAEPAKSAAPSMDSAIQPSPVAPSSYKESVTTAYGQSNYTKRRSAGLIVVSAFTIFFLLYNSIFNYPLGSGGFYVAYTILWGLCISAAIGFSVVDIVFAARKDRNMSEFAIGMMFKAVGLLCTGLYSSVYCYSSGQYGPFYNRVYCFLFFSVPFNSGLLLLYSLLFLTIKESPVVKTVRVEAPVVNPAQSLAAPVSQTAPTHVFAAVPETAEKKDDLTDVAETLKKYKAMQDEGLIDENMYKEKAKKLLGL